ncbi:carbonic anhydrase [Thalassotalea insulae]|uniref:Carbonic anhydrase n=1 Tax=Thalassotalea insulae TaxID=2056778 RepID=A0ABQ6GRV0_9GAMM|nr:carbonate dehydratase [Thalassotalea insulae]GLX77405.1 carbonic anhydrase [Thalassotalea insulae]
MTEITQLLANNINWSKTCVEQDGDFFHRLAAQQYPEYLWIGCSDSRVPANEIVGLAPGELFVHRNIANSVQATDFNCLSVLQYAVEILKVKHVIVCGHYGCGGVQAAMGNEEHGLVDNWLGQIKDIYVKHQQEIDALRFRQQKVNRLCELNVIEQVSHLARTKVVQHAWQRGQSLEIHGWIYSICDGQIKDLQVTVNSLSDVASCYHLTPTNSDSRPKVDSSISCQV